MPARRSDLLSRLPSVNELLQRPPVRELVGQLNRSTVVSGARSYLEQLRTELQDRFAGRSWSSPSELAERAARYILGPYQQQRRVVINATGELVGPRWATIPLGSSAQDALVVLSSGYTLPDDKTPVRPGAIELLCSRSGADDAVVVHSYQGALWLALAALARHREVLIARAEMGHTEGASLNELFATSGARPVEVGSANTAAAADYEARASEETAMLLRVRNDEYRVLGHTCWASCEELAALARDRELSFIAALDRAALDTSEADAARDGSDCEAAMASAAACLAAGADLVLLRGEGWSGGPPCGVMLGRRELVEAVRQHPMFAAWRVDALRMAALTESLRPAARSDQRHVEPNMIRMLAQTPLENLQHRAQRLAEQLSSGDDIESAQAAPLQPGTLDTGRRSSYGVILTLREGRLEALLERLSTASNPILGRVEAGTLVLDLRTVFPEQDQQIATFVGGGSTVSSDPAEPPGHNVTPATDVAPAAN